MAVTFCWVLRFNQRSHRQVSTQVAKVMPGRMKKKLNLLPPCDTILNEKTIKVEIERGSLENCLIITR